MSQGQVVDKLYQLHLSPLYLLFICFVPIIADMLLYDTINGDVCISMENWTLNPWIFHGITMVGIPWVLMEFS